MLWRLNRVILAILYVPSIQAALESVLKPCIPKLFLQINALRSRIMQKFWHLASSIVPLGVRHLLLRGLFDGIGLGGAWRN